MPRERPSLTLCPVCRKPPPGRPDRPFALGTIDASRFGGPRGCCRVCYQALRNNARRVAPEPAAAVLARLRAGKPLPRHPWTRALEPPPPARPRDVADLAARVAAVRAEGLAAMAGRAVPKGGSHKYRFERAPEPETPTGRDLLRLVTRPLAGGGRVRFRGVTPPPLPAADPGLFDAKPPPPPAVRKPNPYRDKAGSVIARNRQRKALGIRDRP